MNKLFEIDDKSSLPIWLQLKNRFIYLIQSGHYLPGDQLPTVRGLAADIEINYNTVSKVYKSLEEDGYIASKHRQGAFVCDVSDKAGVSVDSTAEMVTAEYINRCLELGMTLEEIDERFRLSLKDAKVKRARNRGESHGEESEAADGSARIIDFCGSRANGSDGSDVARTSANDA